MKKHFAILSLIMAGLCTAPHIVRAEDAPAKPAGDKEGRPGGHMNPEERLKMMTEKLSLTQDQHDKIKAIQEKNAPEFKDLMAKGRENLTEADKTKMRELMKAQMEEIGAVLTPEQREKMKEMRAAGRGGDRKGKPGDAK